MSTTKKVTARAGKKVAAPAKDAGAKAKKGESVRVSPHSGLISAIFNRQEY